MQAGGHRFDPGWLHCRPPAFGLVSAGIVDDLGDDRDDGADRLAECVGVVKTTMANKAALIAKTLDLGLYEPALTRVAMLEQHPLSWMVMINGFIVDARTLPEEIQDEARRLGVIPDLQARRAA